MSRIYGRNDTFHRTKKLNIEVNRNGDVVAVWFRCAMIPFDVTVVDDERAADMGGAYTDPRCPISKLIAVELED
jgi:hypothetical protein